MASPQLEHGYTRLANRLLEALVAYPWTSPLQLRITLHVVRQSFGFRRKKCRPASLAELATAMKEPRSSVHLALQTLIAAGILTRDQTGRLSLQKDYERWAPPVQPTGQKKPAAVQPTGHQAPPAPPSEPVQPAGQEDAAQAVQPTGQSVQPAGHALSIGTERKPERNNNHASEPELGLSAGDPMDGFAEWYAAYPEKKARGAAERAWRSLKPSPELRAQILAALAAQKVHRTDAGRRGDFVPRWAYPATWLNQKRWLDEMTPAATPAHGPGAVKAPAGKYASVGERHEIA